MKKCNLADEVTIPNQNEKKAIIKERPNHIYTQGKPAFLGNGTTKSPETSSLIYEIKFLWERCKLMKDQFESLVGSLD